MVSKEDTSMLNALRAAAKAGFTAAEQALPADVAYEAVAPVAEELAFTPTAWSYDAPIAGEAEIADMQRIAADVAADVQAQLENPSLTDGDIKTRLITAKSLLSKSNITASDLRAAIEVARDAVAAAQEERGRTAVSNAEETPEQKVARLEAELKAMDENIAKDLEELRRRGLIDDEEYNRLKAERARLDAMDINDPERIKGEKAYNRALGDVADEAEDKARERGDDEGTKAAGRVKRDAKKRDDVTDEIEAAHAGKAQAAAEQSQPTYATHPSAAPSVYEPTHVEDRSSGQLPTPPAVIAQNDKDQKVGGGVSF